MDATAIAVSLIRNDLETASSVMFMLGIGELLEEWTHKKSVGDLARSMSLNVNKVWLIKDGQEILVPTSEVLPGDHVIVHMGMVIPFDGVVLDGDAMINQASLTGESSALHRERDGYLYAGLIILGVAGVIQPTTSALLHNASTLGISLASMKNLLIEE